MAEESVPEEGTDIRRKAAVRLGIAAAVTALALAGLWWLDQSGKEKPQPRTPVPSPIVSAPAPIPPAPPVEAVEPPPPPEDGRQPAIDEAPVIPPPRPEVSQPSPGKPAVARQAHPITSAPAPAVAKPVPPPVLGDYVVQLGVFSNPHNAEELVERLNKQGIRAYTETRVQVGPFKDKAAAEKAQAELKRMGISGLVGTTK